MSGAPKGPSSPEIKLGDVVLDRYRVVEQIGRGGHSVVFKGIDERLSRPVCIKIFSGLGGDSGVGRTSYEHFVQEAFALSRLTHPNTLRIYDFGHLGSRQAAGMPVQVCEYMNGGTLANIVRAQGKQPLTETVAVISAMCAALAEAHALGIVHRDIKPQNILFGSVGSNRLPKLADFGIAKWSAENEDNQQQRAQDTAIVAGQKLAMYSPSWAAPEQLAGQPVSPATDIYSLAGVAVYMLSGVAIFADEDVYAGYKKRRRGEQLVDETLTPLGVPREVIDVLSRAVAFESKKRLANVEELSTALQRVLADAATRQPAAPLPSPTAMPSGDLMPATFQAPAVQPWMHVVPDVVGTQARRLVLTDVPQPVADRRLCFVPTTNDVADLAGVHGTKLRITLAPGPTGNRVVHVKGLTCFVALLGGRPSPAVHVDRSSDIALVTPRAQEIGHLRIAEGVHSQGEVVFQIGAELVSVGVDDCADAILFDFGPGSNAYFVYTRGRRVPVSGRRG